MRSLVIGSTGTVGGRIVQGLLNRGIEVFSMSHAAEKLRNLPRGVEGRIADLNKPETLQPAFGGVDNVFLLVPVGMNETAQGLHAVQAAKASSVKKIVYLSVYMPEGSIVIPHFYSKVPIENAVRESGIPYTILRPNNFFQNDISLISIIMAYGIYPSPVGHLGLNRIDVRDIAECAVNALVETGYEGQIYSLHGPDTLTGNDMARIYSKYVGRDVRYAGDDLDVWEQHVRNIMPDWLRRDMRVMYKYFQDHGMIAPEADLEKQQVLLGHDPRSFDAFAKELAADWKQSLACAA